MKTKDMMKMMDDLIAELIRRELSDPVNKDVWNNARVALTDAMNKIVALEGKQ